MIDCFFEYQKRFEKSYLIIIGRDDGYESELKKKIDVLGIKEKVIFA